MPRSTVCIDRALCRRVDAWAEAEGLPVGPGHRTQAVERLLEAALARRDVAESCCDGSGTLDDGDGRRPCLRCAMDKEAV